MSSTLTFQLRHQDEEKHNVTTVPTSENLPSPPTSTYSSDEPGDLAYSVPNGESLASSIGSRRDSLPTHFNALTIQQFSTSLPENYTIEHSASPSPITIRRHSTRPDSLACSPASTATAAATGGRTIRHRRQSECSTKKAIHRCEDCGKVYKHPNCLSKHRWEHSEQWELTSKLLLTKHQQVQMLEAAAILVSMDSARTKVEEEDEEDLPLPKRDDGDDEVFIDMEEDLEDSVVDKNLNIHPVLAPYSLTRRSH